MAADDMIANHITLRNGVCRYVRRVPEDLRDAFPFARVQKSLGTRDKRAARQAALALDQERDRRFAEARRRRTMEHFERFMAACLTAESAHLGVFLRESRKGGIRQSSGCHHWSVAARFIATR